MALSALFDFMLLSSGLLDTISIRVCVKAEILLLQAIVHLLELISVNLLLFNVLRLGILFFWHIALAQAGEALPVSCILCALELFAVVRHDTDCREDIGHERCLHFLVELRAGAQAWQYIYLEKPWL